jgi:Mn-dependent DtxR family transcriptional regulator
MTKRGQKIGKSLLYRHNVIEKFLKAIGVEGNILDETEKIEHTIGISTLKQIANLVNFLEQKPDILNQLKLFQSDK